LVWYWLPLIFLVAVVARALAASSWVLPSLPLHTVNHNITNNHLQDVLFSKTYKSTREMGRLANPILAKGLALDANAKSCSFAHLEWVRFCHSLGMTADLPRNMYRALHRFDG
jgi:hypothetical protein